MAHRTLSTGLGGLLLLGTIILLPGGVSADSEPNDDFDTAETVSPGTIEGTLTKSGQQGSEDDAMDFYKFAVSDGQYFVVNFTIDSGNSGAIAVYKKDSASWHSSGWLHSGISWERMFTLGQGDAGNYFMRTMIGAAPDAVRYTIKLKVVDQEDAGQLRDAGDTIDTARTVSPGAFSGWIDELDDDDYYAFAVPAGNRINATLTTGHRLTDDLRVGLYSPRKEYMESTGWVNPDVTKSIIHQTSDTTGGNYYLNVMGHNDYTIAVTLTPENDAGSKADVPAAIDDAFLLPENGTYSGRLRDDDTVDFYKFTVLGGQIITCQILPTMEENDDIMVTLYNPDKNSRQTINWLNPGVPGMQYYVTNTTGGGLYYLKVAGKNSYTLTLNLAMQTDAGLWGDAGDDIRVSRPVEPGREYTGLLRNMDDADYYSFTAEKGKNITINFNLTSGQPTLRLVLYGPDKDSIKGSNWTNVGDQTSLKHLPAASGTYFLHFAVGNASNATYQFNLSLEKDAVPPVIVISSPAGGASLSSSRVTVRGTASDNEALAGVRLLVNGVEVAVNGTTAWSAQATLRNGRNNLVATATDAAGNVASQSITVTYEKPKPQPGFEALLLVAAIVAGSVLVARRRK